MMNTPPPLALAESVSARKVVAELRARLNSYQNSLTAWLEAKRPMRGGALDDGVGTQYGCVCARALPLHHHNHRRISLFLSLFRSLFADCARRAQQPINWWLLAQLAQLTCFPLRRADAARTKETSISRPAASERARQILMHLT